MTRDTKFPTLAWGKLVAGLGLGIYAAARGALDPPMAAMVLFHGAPDSVRTVAWQPKGVFDDRTDACEYAARLAWGRDAQAAVLLFGHDGWPLMGRVYRDAPSWTYATEPDDALAEATAQAAEAKATEEGSS